MTGAVAHQRASADNRRVPKPRKGKKLAPRNELGALSVAFRVKHNLSRGELADKVGCSAHTIVSVEVRSKYRPSELLLKRLEDVGVIPEDWRP